MLALHCSVSIGMLADSLNLCRDEDSQVMSDCVFYIHASYIDSYTVVKQ